MPHQITSTLVSTAVFCWAAVAKLDGYSLPTQVAIGLACRADILLCDPLRPPPPPGASRPPQDEMLRDGKYAEELEALKTKEANDDDGEGDEGEGGSVSTMDALDLLKRVFQLKRFMGDGSGGSANGNGEGKMDADSSPDPEETMVQAGCTAVVAVKFGNELFVANAGDSRGVLSRAGKAIALSEDHKPAQEGERTRIIAAGGFLSEIGGVCRVNGNLNLSRAIGDLKYKGNTELPAKDQIITAQVGRRQQGGHVRRTKSGGVASRQARCRSSKCPPHVLYCVPHCWLAVCCATLLCPSLDPPPPAARHPQDHAHIGGQVLPAGLRWRVGRYVQPGRRGLCWAAAGPGDVAVAGRVRAPGCLPGQRPEGGPRCWLRQHDVRGGAAASADHSWQGLRRGQAAPVLGPCCCSRRWRGCAAASTAC